MLLLIAGISLAASATVTLQPVGITLAPTSVTLTALQTQQFSASVSAPNVEVTWSLSPSVGTGTISSTGLYTAPDCIALPQTVTVLATSVADGSRSASATITLRNASGYSFQRAIVIDHTKAGSADLTNFPMLFSGTYSYLAAAGSGGGVQNANGFDIIFASDPAGTTKLDFEVESYNPATGQIVAWVRIPTLSHTKDTIVYLNYGNSSITTSQSNRPGVWESSFKAVFHLGNGLTLNPNDATSNAVTGTNVNGVTAVAGTIDGAAGFNGSRYITGSGINLANSPFTISVWQKATNPAGNQPTFQARSAGAAGLATPLSASVCQLKPVPVRSGRNSSAAI